MLEYSITENMLAPRTAMVSSTLFSIATAKCRACSPFGRQLRYIFDPMSVHERRINAFMRQLMEILNALCYLYKIHLRNN